MKSTGILMSSPMVRAILEGRKTQTRRVLKFEPEQCQIDTLCSYNAILRVCPYGGLGDEIWIRETWQFCRGCGRVNFKADKHDAGCICFEPLGKWRPSIFLHKVDSRIRRTLTAIRVERLQGISVEDCIAEGISTNLRESEACSSLKEQYENLWTRINGKKHPWSSNPWVWVLEWKNP